MRNYKAFVILVSGLITLNFFSCKTIKTTAIIDKEEIDSEFLRENYLPNRVAFKSLSIPRLRVTVKNQEQEVSLNGNLRMVKDSAMLLSLNAGLGIEVARVFADQSGIQVINRINSAYERIGFLQVKSVTGLFLEYQMIEQILFNSFCAERLFRSKSAEIEFLNEFFVIHDKSSSLIEGFPETRIFLRRNDLLVSRIELMNTTKERFAFIEYSSIKEVENGVFIPHKIDFFVNNAGDLNTMSLEYLRVFTNTVNTINFTIPNKYL